jgi:hypothetical protein
MRKLSPSLALLASVTAFASTHGASADTIPFDKVPLLPASPPASTPPATAQKVDKIPATEKLDGFFPAILPADKRKDEEKGGYRNIQVFTNDKDQRDYAVDGTWNKPLGTMPGMQQCLSTSTNGDGLSPRVSFYYRTKPYPWEIEQAKHKPPSKKPAPPQQKANVRPIHQEKLTVAGDAATLENIDAQIDLETLGVRLVSKSMTKLAKVAGGPNGIAVFAARDEKGVTQFLVTHPELPAAPSDDVRQAFVDRLSSTAERLFAQLPAGSTTQSGCGHVRFTLSTKAGGGQMATVLATAFLPPARDLDEAPPEPEETNDNADAPEDNSFEVQMRKQRSRVQRARPVAINVSVSQLQSEESPLLSVTFGWAGKDEKLGF